MCTPNWVHRRTVQDARHTKRQSRKAAVYLKPVARHLFRPISSGIPLCSLLRLHLVPRINRRLLSCQMEPGCLCTVVLTDGKAECSSLFHVSSQLAMLGLFSALPSLSRNSLQQLIRDTSTGPSVCRNIVRIMHSPRIQRPGSCRPVSCARCPPVSVSGIQ